MNILHINSVFGTGSTGRIVADIHKKLLHNQHNSYVIYCRNYNGTFDESNAYCMTTQMGNYRHVFATRLTDKHGLFSYNETMKIIPIIKKFNPDIIHLHNIHSYYLNYEVLFEYLKTIDAQIVWTLHDCWSFTGHCSHYTYVKCNKFETICNNCEIISEYPKSYIDNSSYNFSMKKKMFTKLNNLTLVTPSLWLKKEVKKSFLSEYNIKVINNGIDLDSFKNNVGQTNLKQNARPYILGVANVWNNSKGINTFIKLSEIIGEDFDIILLELIRKLQKITVKYKTFV